MPLIGQGPAILSVLGTKSLF